MADIQSNINVNINTASAMASIRALQSQISAFQKEMASSSTANVMAAKNLQKAFIDDINATGKFSASIKTISSTADSFTRSLEKNKLSLGEYFRYGMGASKSFSKYFQSEFETVNKVARERVKDLQTQYVSLGRDASGALKSIAIRPLTLDMKDLGTQAQITAQRAQIFNQILKQGSTNLLNFGKNTQWAGRQLMVGFTVPLSIFGAKAAQAYKEIEESAIKFKRVYGDATTPSAETNAMIKQIRTLGIEFTKYGVSMANTMDLAQKAAAMGKTGKDLLGQISQANTLSVLGGVDQEQALNTTITLTNTFGYTTEQLANKVNYLNAVENQTVLSIEDLTVAIPKAGPVVKQLGGDIEDLSVFMTAMKEGGINASEGANALKSGLASLINPTKASSQMLLQYGINLKDIVGNNQGNVSGLVRDFGKALDTLDPTTRAQAIEKMFGKFQFARISTLLQNISKDGTQAARALELSQMTAAQLAAVSRKELNQVENSPLYKFQQAIEKFKAAMAPVGEEFMKMVTPLINFGTKILDMFNNMSDGSKKFVTILVGVVGGLAPVFIMTFGLIANALANAMKGFLFLRNRILGLGKDSKDLGLQTNYMSTEQLQAATVAASLDQVHSRLIQTFTSEAEAIDMLRVATERAVAAQARMGGVRSAGTAKPQNFADGGLVVRGPGGPKDDSVPANLSNGEVVLSVDTVKKNPAIVDALLSGQKVKVPGYADGTEKSKVREFYATTGNMYQAAHFSGHTEMTGAQLKDFAANDSELAAGVERVFANLMKRLEEEAKAAGQEFDKAAAELKILTEKFDIYDNRVISMDKDLNNLFGRSGSGGKASATEVAAKLRQGGKDAHMQAALAMHRQGATPEEQEQAITQLEDAVNKSMQEFIDNEIKNATGVEDVSQLTAEQYKKAAESIQISGDGLDKVIQNAYESVAKNNTKLELAYAEMSKVSGYALAGDLNTNEDSSRNRKGFAKRNFYADTRGQAYENMQNLNVDAGRQDVFIEIQKRKFERVLEDAIGQILAVDPQAFTNAIQMSDVTARHQELKRLVEQYGIELTQTAAMAIENGIITGAKRQLDIQSPSRVTETIGRQAGQGLIIGAESTVAQAAIAGQEIGNALASSSQANMYPGMDASAITPQVKAARRKFGSLDAIPNEVKSNLGIPIVEKQAGRLASIMSTFSGKFMAISGAVSSVLMGLQLFGVDLGTTGQALLNLSNVAFGVVMAFSQMKQMGMLDMLGKTKIGSTVLGEGKAVAGQVAAQGGLKAIFSEGGLLGGFKNLGGIVTRFAPMLLRFAGGIGLAIAAFQAFQWIAGVIKEQQEKITGLGEAANFASGAINKFAGGLGENIPEDTNWGDQIGGGFTSTKTQSAMDKGLEGYKGDTRQDKLKSFAEENSLAINGLKGGTKQQATEALQSTALKMQMSGNTKATTEAFIKTIIAAADDPKLKNIDVGKTIIGHIFDPGKAADNADAVGKGIEASVTAYGKNVAKDAKTNKALGAGYLGGTGSSYSGNYMGGRASQFGPVSSAETQKAGSLLAGKIEAGAQGLKTAFDTKQLNVAQYKKAINGLIDPLNKLQGAARKNAIADLSKKIGGSMPNLIAKTKDGAKQLAILKLALSGNITGDLKKKIEAGTASIDDLTKALGKNQEAQAAVNKEEAKAGLQANITANQAQIDTYYGLVKAGFSAADALSLMSDSAVQAAVSAGLAADQVATLKGQLAELAKIQKAGSGGAAKEDPFKNAMDSLKNQLKEAKNIGPAYSKLRKSGLDVSTAWKYANDSTIAAGLAAANTTGKVKKITDAIKALEKQLKANSWNTFKQNMAEATKDLQAQLDVTAKLSGMGASLEEIQALLSNPDFMLAFKSGKVTAEGFADALAEVKKQAAIKIKIDMSTPEGMQSKIDEAYGKVQEAFDAQKTAIELKYDAKMKSDKDAVKQAERDIADINAKVQEYEGGLQEISWKEDEINKKYDDRKNALDKIQKINEEISRQQKSQLTIADALSQGDISAAARAIQDAQSGSAAAAIQSSSDALDTARNQELGSVTDSKGRSREQLEKSVLDAKKEIFKIEQETLNPANERLRILEQQKADEIDSITVLGKTATEWAAIKSQIDLARINTDTFKNSITSAFEATKALLAAYAKLGSKQGNVVSAVDQTVPQVTAKPTATNTADKIDKLVTPVSSSIPAGVPASALVSGYGAKVNTTTLSGVLAASGLGGKSTSSGYTLPAGVPASALVSGLGSRVAKAMGFATGGKVPGMGSSDTQPAMLTPGEYVVNKDAVSKYGSGLLSAINNGTFSPNVTTPRFNVGEKPNMSISPTHQDTGAGNSSSVYNNYTLSVNVKSDANPTEIARVVMDKLRTVEAQKARGVRI